jgi:general secretion pathway protein I
MADARPDAGFTLIEVLIALAVVSICLVSIGAVVSANVRGVREIETRVTMVAQMRSLLVSAAPRRDRLLPGVSGGALPAGRWTMQVSPLGDGWDVPTAQSGWLPELVALRVRSASGAIVDVHTVRLARVAP